nr:gustatory receptor 23 [Papilio memnon]
MIVKQHSAVDTISACIVNCMKPLLYVENCFGIFRYRLGERSSDAIGMRMKILSVAITAAWTIPYICVVTNGHMFINAVVIADYMISLLIGAAYVTSTLILVLWQTQNNRKVIEMFADIDITLHANIDQTFYKMSSRHCKILFTLYLLFCAIGIANIPNFSTYKLKLVYLIFTLIYFERKIELCVFCQFLYMLKQRLLLIKNYLSKCTDLNHGMFRTNKVKKLDFDFIGNISSSNFKVRDLAIIYCKVGKVFMLINKIYSYLIVITLVTAFFFILVNSWAILYSHKINYYFVVSLSLLFYLFAEFLSIILISYYCEEITVVREKIKSMLHGILCHADLPIQMSKQVNIFVRLTNIWHLSFNVIDMLDVDLSLILKFVSICTSYLIVIIQINRLI